MSKPFLIYIATILKKSCLKFLAVSYKHKHYFYFNTDFVFLNTDCFLNTDLTIHTDFIRVYSGLCTRILFLYAPFFLHAHGFSRLRCGQWLSIESTRCTKFIYYALDLSTKFSTCVHYAPILNLDVCTQLYMLNTGHGSK